MYEFTDGKVKHLYDRDKKLRFIDIDWELELRGEDNLIVSYHNFDETPDLEMILSQMKLRHPKARYYKIATFANSTLDALKMLKFQRKHAKVIGICMGEKGVVTRIMSPFTYAPLTESDKNAPGSFYGASLKRSIATGRLRLRRVSMGSSEIPSLKASDIFIITTGFVSSVWMPFM